MAPTPAEKQLLHSGERATGVPIASEEDGRAGASVSFPKGAAARGSRPSFVKEAEYHAVPVGEAEEHNPADVAVSGQHEATQSQNAERKEGAQAPPAAAGTAKPDPDLEKGPGAAGPEAQPELKKEATSAAPIGKLEMHKVAVVSYDTTGLTTAQVEELRKKYGWNEVNPHQDPEWIKIARRYLSLVPMLLIVAALFAVCVKEDGVRDWFSFALLIFLDNLMVWADYLGERSAHNAIKAVQKLGAPRCNVKRDGNWEIHEVRELVPQDIVSLKGGVVVPADGVFCTTGATITVDEAALTGESLPIRKYPGSNLLSGSVVQKGIGEMVVTKTGQDSFYGKTIALLARAERPGHLRTVLHKTSIFITGVAACFAAFLFFWQSFHHDWKEIIPHHRYLVALKRAFILIASVIPAAMPVVTTTVLSVGALVITKQNAAVSRLSAIEEAAGVVILFSDKTGTLTKNQLSLFKEEMSIEKGYDEATLLLYASLCSETLEPEPIDKIINENTDFKERAKYQIKDFTPFNPVDKRTEARVVGPDGHEFLVSKGAPQVISGMVCGSGNEQLRERLDELILAKAKRGFRTLGVAIKPLSDYSSGNSNSQPESQPSTAAPGSTQNGAATDHTAAGDGSSAPQEAHLQNWQLVGYICFFDPPREDTAETLRRAGELGIQVKMVTGDQLAIAIETARQLGLGTNIAGPDIWDEVKKSGTVHGKPFAAYIQEVNGFAGVYPEHKFAIVDAMMDAHHLVAMTGDGVNDAPALKRATVGIAVSGATDAARAAADIVLFAPGLKTIITVISLSRQIFKRVESYIIFRIFTSLIILGMWWGCIVILRYQFPAWVLVLMSMINDFVLMSCSHDRVSTSKLPMIWSMIRVIALSFWLALLATICILLYVFFSDPSHRVDWWPRWNLPSFIRDWPLPVTKIPMSCQTNAGVWLLMTLLIQLCFESVRTRGFFCVYNNQNRFPALVIVIPQLCAVIITIFLVVYWGYHWRVASGPLVRHLTWGQAGVTIFWALLWFAVMDCSKVLFYIFGWPALANNKLSKKLQRWLFPEHIPTQQELENRSAAHKAFDNMTTFFAERQAEVEKIETKVQDSILYSMDYALKELVSAAHFEAEHIRKKGAREATEKGEVSSRKPSETAGGSKNSNNQSTGSNTSNPGAAEHVAHPAEKAAEPSPARVPDNSGAVGPPPSVAAPPNAAAGAGVAAT